MVRPSALDVGGRAPNTRLLPPYDSCDWWPLMLSTRQVVGHGTRACVSLNLAAALRSAGRSSAQAFSIAGLISSHDSPAVLFSALRRSVAPVPCTLSCWDEIKPAIEKEIGRAHA